jgi:hypothetical protein
MRAPILVGVLLVVVGLLLVFLPSHDGLGQRLSNLGVEMLGGAVIAFAFGWIEQRVERRQAEAAERQRLQQEKVAERQRLQLTLGLQKDLTEIILTKLDLSPAFTFVRKS